MLLSSTLADANPTVLALATATGGWPRWSNSWADPLAGRRPHLARLAGDPAATPAIRNAVEVTFQTLNRYLGVAVGEHLGYLFAGRWTALAGVALQSDLLHPVFGIIGLVLAPLFCARVAGVRRTLRATGLEGRRHWSHSPTSAGRCGCWRWASLCWPPPDRHCR